MDVRERITAVLAQAEGHEGTLYDELLPLVYTELKDIAHHHLRGERAGHTLSTTALVHEAYFKLVDQEASWQNRSHFLAVASMAMRRILVNYARDRARLKRGGGAPVLSLDDAPDLTSEAPGVDVMALDDALERLGGINAQAARVIECRFFGGLTIAETAYALGISATTVKHQWRLAKTWLRRELGP
jgi:RNA polymerase sigma factor (TIGR02999 family)